MYVYTLCYRHLWTVKFLQLRNRGWLLLSASALGKRLTCGWSEPTGQRAPHVYIYIYIYVYAYIYIYIYIYMYICNVMYTYYVLYVCA